MKSISSPTGLSRITHRRGFTLVEMMIGLVIASGLGLVVAGLQYTSARSIKQLYNQTRSRSHRMQAVDQIRYRLYSGRIGSCALSEMNHRLEFNDPNLGTTTSAFYFDTEEGFLYYDEDISDANVGRRIAWGLSDVTFDLDATGGIVLLSIESTAIIRYDDEEVRTEYTQVYLRNI